MAFYSETDRELDHLCRTMNHDIRKGVGDAATRHERLAALKSAMGLAEQEELARAAFGDHVCYEIVVIVPVVEKQA